jgi:hypothetical protein
MPIHKKLEMKTIRDSILGIEVSGNSVTPWKDDPEGMVCSTLLRHIFLHKNNTIMTHPKQATACANARPCPYMIIERILVNFGPAEMSAKIQALTTPGDPKKPLLFAGCPFYHEDVEIKSVDMMLNSVAFGSRTEVGNIRAAIARLYSVEVQVLFNEKVRAVMYNVETGEYRGDLAIPVVHIARKARAADTDSARPSHGAARAPQTRTTSPRAPQTRAKSPTTYKPAGTGWMNAVTGGPARTEIDVETIISKMKAKKSLSEELEELRVATAAQEKKREQILEAIEMSRQEADMERKVAEMKKIFAENERQNKALLSKLYETIKPSQPAKAAQSGPSVPHPVVKAAQPASPVAQPVTKAAQPASPATQPVTKAAQPASPATQPVGKASKAGIFEDKIQGSR